MADSEKKECLQQCLKEETMVEKVTKFCRLDLE